MSTPDDMMSFMTNLTERVTKEKGVSKTTPELDSSKTLFFTCPNCGSPLGDTVEFTVDIHYGAIYNTECCGEKVIFEAFSLKEYDLFTELWNTYHGIKVAFTQVEKNG